MKSEQFDWCIYCKEELNLNDNYVHYDKKLYHFDCFCTLYDIVLELDDEE